MNLYWRKVVNMLRLFYVYLAFIFFSDLFPSWFVTCLVLVCYIISQISILALEGHVVCKTHLACTYGAEFSNLVE